jgi:hypothetical protein
VSQLVDEAGLTSTDVLVLAHAAATSRACSGGGSALRTTDSRLVKLAMSVHRVQLESASAAERLDGLRQCQRLVRELADDDQVEAQYLTSRGMNARTFRDSCLRIAMACSPPFDVKPSTFKAELVANLGAHPILGCSTSQLRTPNGDAWPVDPRSGSDALAHSTIHGFKGLQSPAVVLVLPQERNSSDDGIAQWQAGRSGEERRVLYVGASRAERLLILATHRSRLGEVTQKLTSDGVPFRLSPESDA